LKKEIQGRKDKSKKSEYKEKGQRILGEKRAASASPRIVRIAVWKKESLLKDKIEKGQLDVGSGRGSREKRNAQEKGTIPKQTYGAKEKQLRQGEDRMRAGEGEWGKWKR